MKASVFNIQKFCTEDGAGVRTTVFFAGCPLDCRWCHNPEGKNLEPKLIFHKSLCIGCGGCAVPGCEAGTVLPRKNIDRSLCKECFRCVEGCPTGALEKTSRLLSVDGILDTVLEDRAFYGDRGGITLSGGEPFFQTEAAIELLSRAKAAGLSTAVETSGYFDGSCLGRAVPLVDTFLWDVKDTCPERFFENTKGDLGRILDNLKRADSLGAKIRLRCLLIHGVNTDKSHAEALLSLVSGLSDPDGVDLIKYHPMGRIKYEELGLSDDFDSDERIPDDADMGLFKAVLRDFLN